MNFLRNNGTGTNHGTFYLILKNENDSYKLGRNKTNGNIRLAYLTGPRTDIHCTIKVCLAHVMQTVIRNLLFHLSSRISVWFWERKVIQLVKPLLCNTHLCITTTSHWISRIDKTGSMIYKRTEKRWKLEFPTFSADVATSPDLESSATDPLAWRQIQSSCRGSTSSIPFGVYTVIRISHLPV